MNLDRFEKYNETADFIAYLEKNPLFSGLREVIVYYKKYDRYMRTILTRNTLTSFFNPTDYAKIIAEGHSK